MTDQELSEPVMQAVRSGQKVRAIKLLREETGLGLKEAKDIIDREVDTYRRENPHAPMVQESTPWGKVVVTVLIIVALYWFFTKGG